MYSLIEAFSSFTWPAAFAFAFFGTGIVFIIIGIIQKIKP